MLRTRLLCLLTVLAVAVGFGPGHAGAAAAPSQLTDRCGDAGTYVHAQSRDTELETGQGAWDLRAGRVRLLYAHGRVSALQVTTSVCGVPSAGDDYATFWGLPNGCDLAVEYIARDAVLRVVVPEVRLAESCYQHSDGLSGYTGADVVSEAILAPSRAAFAASSVVITIPMTEVPAAMRHWFATGTRWTPFSAAACDPNGCADVFAGGGIANPNLLASVRLDIGYASGSYRVGQDAPR